MLQLRRALPALQTMCWSKQFSTTSGAWAGAADVASKNVDISTELLPPGCSLTDPTYGLNESQTTVLFYEDDDDEQPEDAGRRKRADKRVPPTPASRAAAEKSLSEKKQAEEKEHYVYLPPGSSMIDPAYNSMSDPGEPRKVYRRDPGAVPAGSE